MEFLGNNFPASAAGATPVPSLESLFQDFQQDQRHLELDFNGPDFSTPAVDRMPCFPPQRFDAWQPSNPSQFGVPGALPLDILAPQANGSILDMWKGFRTAPSVSMPDQFEAGSQSSPESLQTSFPTNPPQTGANLPMTDPVTHQQNMSIDSPQLPPIRGSRPNARQAAAQEKERERAEKLKEKNKRAQRKFRQRQKDRQESAEKLAMDLADELKRMKLEKEGLESRNKQLELILEGVSGSMQQSQKPNDDPDAEPTFTPAKGWTTFHPRRGLILMAICSPRKLTHRQMMSLSLRDIAKLLTELTRRLKDCIAAVEQPEPDPHAETRIQALLNERHAVMSYFAVNNQRALYQILSCKLTDPPEPSPESPPLCLWQKCVDDMELTEQQKANLLETRRHYVRKLDEILAARKLLQNELQEMDLMLQPQDLHRAPGLHLQWVTLTERLKANVEMTHRYNAYYMVRIWYGDCFTPMQLARFLVAAYPYNPNVFVIMWLMSQKLGNMDHMQLLEMERRNPTVGQLPIDVFADAWPTVTSSLDEPSSESFLDGREAPPREEIYSERLRATFDLPRKPTDSSSSGVAESYPPSDRLDDRPEEQD